MSQPTFAEELKSTGEKIVKYVNDSDIFKFSVIFDQTKKNGQIHCTFRIKSFEDFEDLVAGTWMSVTYYMEQNNRVATILGIGVNSSLGHKVGHFLFTLQLLLISITNTSVLTLDNYTDDPGRASHGIYSLLEPNWKEAGIPRKNRKGTPEEVMQTVEGMMKYDLASNNISNIYKELLKIGTKIRQKSKSKSKSTIAPNVGNIWHNNPKENIQKFIDMMHQTYQSGGKVRKTKRKKTKRNRKKTKWRFS